MGKPKLLLPWPSSDAPGARVIDRVLKTWTDSCVDKVVIVVRRDDTELRSACESWPVDVACPDSPPADMKASLLFGLQWIDRQYGAQRENWCFVAPADLPTLKTSVVNELADQRRPDTYLLVPKFGTHQGHPVLFRWKTLSEIKTLPDNEGLNVVVDQTPKRVIQFSAADDVTDVDTPHEYDQALNRWRESRDPNS